LNGESVEAKVCSAWGMGMVVPPRGDSRDFYFLIVCPCRDMKMSNMGLFDWDGMSDIEVEMSDIFLKCSK